MPLPRLYIAHPPESRLPGITGWLARIEERVRSSAVWDQCVIVRFVYNEQAGFDVPTLADHVLRNPGPVILIQKVQQRLRSKLGAMVLQRAVVFCVPIASEEDLWTILETARASYEDGEPRIPAREVIAFLIVRKLSTQDKWGGKSKDKSFLWADDLPKGGFPKELSDRREILNVAQMLAMCGVLATKKSRGQIKYGLGDKTIVQPILDTQSFATAPKLRKFFEKQPQRVPSRLLDFK